MAVFDFDGVRLSTVVATIRDRIHWYQAILAKPDFQLMCGSKVL